MSRARPFEHQIAIGRKRQTDIVTVAIEADLISLSTLNAAPAVLEPTFEDDAAYIGKGHEWPTEQFFSHWDFSASIEKNLSAEFAAWAFAFALGNVVNDPPGTYTCIPLLPSGGVDSPELPYFTFIEAIRQGTYVVLDRMAVGCAIEDLALAITTGPGRAAAKLTVNIVGSGLRTEPSGIVIPLPHTAEVCLPAASAALSILTTDYILDKTLVSIEVSYKNNIDLTSGFHPGSGFQDDDPDLGAIRSRLEFGNRVAGLRFTARFENGSPEITALQALTPGEAVLVLTYSAGAKLTITFHKVVYRTARVVNDGETTSITVEGLPLYHPDYGLLTVEAVCALTDICELPSA